VTLKRDPNPHRTPLRQARKDKGWTLKEAAEKCGVSVPFLSLLERGYRPDSATDEDIARVECVLGAPAGELQPEEEPVIYHICGGEP